MGHSGALVLYDVHFLWPVCTPTCMDSPGRNPILEVSIKERVGLFVFVCEGFSKLWAIHGLLIGRLVLLHHMATLSQSQIDA